MVQCMTLLYFLHINLAHPVKATGNVRNTLEHQQNSIAWPSLRSNFQKLSVISSFRTVTDIHLQDTYTHTLPQDSQVWCFSPQIFGHLKPLSLAATVYAEKKVKCHKAKGQKQDFLGMETLVSKPCDHPKRNRDFQKIS